MLSFVPSAPRSGFGPRMLVSVFVGKCFSCAKGDVPGNRSHIKEAQTVNASIGAGPMPVKSTSLALGHVGARRTEILFTRSFSGKY